MNKRPISSAAATLKYINEALAAESEMNKAKNKHWTADQYARRKVLKFLREDWIDHDLEIVKQEILEDYPSLREKYE